MFFGHYYAGLGEAVLGHRERAIELLRRAVEDARGAQESGLHVAGRPAPMGAPAGEEAATK